MENTNNSLKSTQRALQGSIMQNDQLQKELSSSHTLPYMEDGHLHMEYDIVDVMKEPHVEDKNEKGADFSGACEEP